MRLRDSCRTRGDDAMFMFVALTVMMVCTGADHFNSVWIVDILQLWYASVAVPFCVIFDSFTGVFFCAITVAGAQLCCFLLSLQNGETILASACALVAVE